MRAAPLALKQHLEEVTLLLTFCQKARAENAVGIVTIKYTALDA
jgi:hypothetical protein